jgi:nitroimidazol reductase NimA-like FMN-containing flavoprotein (pyridoxamine 5'-phosphate oxidase superfamily)
MTTGVEGRLVTGAGAASASPRSGPLVLTNEERRAVLAHVGWGVLATVGDGQPYGVPVGYALASDCVYVASGPGRKRRNLEANPRVCLTVCEIATYDRWRSVVVQGETEPVEGVAERAAAVAAFVVQRAPRARPGVTDVKRLLGARLLRLPLDAMTGRGRGSES